MALMLVTLLAQQGYRSHAEGGAEKVGIGPRQGGAVTIGWTTDLESVNPLISSGNSASREIQAQLFLHLLDEQPDSAQHPPTLLPQLARSYDLSSDHQTITFHLRSDVTWSDGVPVTAEDVKWTFDTQKNRLVRWNNAYTKDAIANVEVVDLHTASFHFLHSYPKQLLDANEGPILPKHAWRSLPLDQWRGGEAWFRTHLVVDGPFTIDSWGPGPRFALRRNDRYYNRPWPYLDKVIFVVNPDQSKLTMAVMSGTIDFTPQVYPPDVGQIRRDPKLELKNYWHPLVVAIAWNNQRFPFDNPEVRRALTLAIDRTRIVDSLFGEDSSAEPWGRIATSPIVASVWAHNWEIKPLPYDPQAARKALANQGFSVSDGGATVGRNGPVSFNLATNFGNPPRTTAAGMIRDQLREVGILVRPQVTDFNEMLTQVRFGNFDAAIVGLTMDTGLDLTADYHSKSIASGENLARYSNPQADELMTRVMDYPSMLDQRFRSDILKIQTVIDRDQPYTLLWESQRLNVVNRRVHDVRPNSGSSLANLDEWWVDSQAK